jgi:hypothetical protein
VSIAGVSRGRGAWLAPCARRVLFTLLLTAGAAHASGMLGAPPSSAEACLAPALTDRVKPDYPPAMLAIKRGARVHARFTFSGPDRAPSVEVNDTPHEFAEAVREYAKQLRVPCMVADDAPVTLRQDFDFVPNEGRKVALTLPVDETAAARSSSDRCGVHLTGPGIPAIAYPEQALHQRLEGNVVVRLHFSDPTLGPEMTVLDNGGSKEFVHAILPSVEALRMACLGKDPVDVQVFYSFQIDGAANRVVLRDLSLVQFLHAVKAVPPEPAYFDTKLMKCPFDVRLTFRQPWNRNRIDELDEDIEARHAFLNWLSTMELNVDGRAANHVLGQSMLIQVPCTVVDL